MYTLPRKFLTKYIILYEKQGFFLSKSHNFYKLFHSTGFLLTVFFLSVSYCLNIRFWQLSRQRRGCSRSGLNVSVGSGSSGLALVQFAIISTQSGTEAEDGGCHPLSGTIWYHEQCHGWVLPSPELPHWVECWQRCPLLTPQTSHVARLRCRFPPTFPLSALSTALCLLLFCFTHLQWCFLKMTWF